MQGARGSETGRRCCRPTSLCRRYRSSRHAADPCCSSAARRPRRSSLPRRSVHTAPVRARRVGSTLSNRSTPNRHTPQHPRDGRRPSGNAARRAGSSLSVIASSSAVRCLGSPMLKPPSANPGGWSELAARAACCRRSANMPPCTSANSVCSVERRAVRLRRHQAWVRSSARSASAREASAATHSSRGMMRSAPSRSCASITHSGVSSIDSKRTPVSETSRSPASEKT